MRSLLSYLFWFLLNFCAVTKKFIFLEIYCLVGTFILIKLNYAHLTKHVSFVMLPKSICYHTLFKNVQSTFGKTSAQTMHAELLSSPSCLKSQISWRNHWMYCRLISMQFLQLKDAMHVSSIQYFSLQVIINKTKEVLAESSFEEVELATVQTVLDQDELNIDSELELFDALQKWAIRECARKGEMVFCGIVFTLQFKNIQSSNDSLTSFSRTSCF